MNCRHCRAPLEHIVLDLGFAPPSNRYLTLAELAGPERYFPLRLYVCTQCWLVQSDDYACPSELFDGDYAYFSSVSKSWLEHAAQYTSMIRERLALDARSFVIEIGANDGYLLRNFVAAGIPCLGIEPTASTAAAAEAVGVPVLREFFSKGTGDVLAAASKKADLIIANNVFAHVPDVNDFAAGLKIALRSRGTVTVEFPHLMRLLEHAQFDTVYHEHFSYLSLHSVDSIFAGVGLLVWDVEELTTHGGSLRVYAGHADNSPPARAAVAALLAEACAGLTHIAISRRALAE